MRPQRVAWAFLLAGAFMDPTGTAGAADRKPVDAALVARPPAPGTVVPGAIAFTNDGKAVTFLKSESNDLSRVLWRAGVDGKDNARVIARPPGQGDTDANVSPAEALRRERQRLRDTGITHAIRAAEADVAIFPLGGDLYLLRGDGPLERLTDTASPELDPQPSSDGSKVAFARDGELFVLDVASKREIPLSRGATEGVTHGLAEFMAQEEMDRSSGFWWAPDGSKVAYQETDERAIPLFTIAHPASDPPTVETHRYPFAGKTNAAVRLGVVKAAGGPTDWLKSVPIGADRYLARVAWDGPKDLLVQILSREQKTLTLLRVDVESDRATTLVEETAPTWVNLHDDLRVVPKTGEILWSSERTGFRHLELRDRDGKLVRTLTAGDWPVDRVLRLDAARREVWFAAGRESPLEAHAYRVSLDGGPILRVTQEAGTHNVVVAPDGEHFVDTHSSRTKPPTTTIRDRDGKLLATLDDAGDDPRLKDLRLDPPRLTEFRSRDGVTLHGAFSAPTSRALGPKPPLIVMLYGGPHVQLVTDSWALTANMTAHYLASRGFAVWTMDNRGSSRRGHAFEAALNRHMGTVEVRDQVDGVKFVAASWPEVDTARVGVTGGSYGGYMTLRCLTEAPEVFKAGVAVAPVTDWDDYDTCYTERYMGTPADNPEGYTGSSVLTRADRLAGDLLIVHGMIDENVHFRHTARLVTALIAAGKPFEVLPLPGERHSSRRPPDRQYEAERKAAFFEKSLAR